MGNFIMGGGNYLNYRVELLFMVFRVGVLVKLEGIGFNFKCIRKIEILIFCVLCLLW